MVWRLVASAGRIVQLDASLYDYRVRMGSAMSKVDDRRMDGMKLFSGLESFIEEATPEFFPAYKKYGVARWVWSTVWQEAVAAKSYKEFKTRIAKYSPEQNMKALFDFDEAKIRMPAFLFVYMRYFYYVAIKIVKCNYRKIG